MPLADLDETERGVVRECLRAAAESQIFPDSEFETIFFGLQRDEVKSVLESWPEIDEADESVTRAVNNSMLNLLGYPSRCKEQEWPKFISVGKSEVWRILRKWNGAETRDYKVRDYFDELM